MTWMRYQSASVSAIRRRLSPYTRSHRSTTAIGKPPRELHLDQGQHPQLVVPDRIIGVRVGEPDGLAHVLHQFQGDARLGAELPEGLPAQPGEPVEIGKIQEVERQVAGADGRADPLKWHARLLEALQEPRPLDVTG
jgi:hypothetical protein